MTDQQKLILPFWEAKTAFAAVLPHCSKDDVTPVITAVNVTEQGVIATDRYTVALHELSVTPAQPFMLHSSAAQWIAKLNPRTLIGLIDPVHEYRFVIEPGEGTGPDAKPDRVTLTSNLYGDERMMRFRKIQGNYPPVERLISGHTDAEVAYPIALDPVHMEKVTTWARQYHRHVPVRWMLAKPADGSTSAKHPPIQAKIGGLTALIQPNLMMR